MISILEELKVVPVIVLDRADAALPLAEALAGGGLPIAEITLRTESAPEAIGKIAKGRPDVLVGAGTVLCPEHVERAVGSGARFIVSPGLYEPVVEAAIEAGVPVFPGVSTATEVQRAWNLGLRVLKFFPAAQAGGVPALRALSAPFGDVKFVPTGGISPENLGEYLRLPAVAACGGSWLVPPRAIEAGEFQAVADLAARARAIADRAGE